jgi:cobalt-zinc-cadmium efflux system protein
MKHDHSGKKVDNSKKVKIYFAFFITFSFGLVEYITGHLFNSLALIADAAHMMTDSIALLIASIGMYFSSKPASKRFTYGLSKMEVSAAIINLILITFVVFEIFSNTYQRFFTETVINSEGVILIASIGLIVNLFVFHLLHFGYQSLNTKAAKMHVIGDILGSIAAIFSGLMIYFFNLTIFDPIMSIIVCIILIRMAVKLLKEVSIIILDAVPENIDLILLKKEIIDLDEKLIDLHDLHVWKCTDKEISLTAHIDISDLDNWNCILLNINSFLEKKYKIRHITLQPELQDAKCYYQKNCNKKNDDCY